MKTEIVYGLHFIDPLSEFHTSQHYIGSCMKHNLFKRLHAHAYGKSNVPYIKAYFNKGIPFVVFALWTGDRKLERHIKNYKNSKKLCPICRDRRLLLEQIIEEVQDHVL